MSHDAEDMLWLLCHCESMAHSLAEAPKELVSHVADTFAKMYADSSFAHMQASVCAENPRLEKRLHQCLSVLFKLAGKPLPYPQDVHEEAYSDAGDASVTPESDEDKAAPSPQ